MSISSHNTQSDSGSEHPPGTSQVLDVHRHSRDAYSSEHIVQFYTSDGFLLDSVSNFMAEGLNEGAACILLMTQPHQQGLEQRLHASGFDVSMAQKRHRYIALDATEALSHFMVDGMPHHDHFIRFVGNLMEQTRRSKQPVRIFGEMVASLWTAGQYTATLQLETLWNEVCAGVPPFILLCGYSQQCFAGMQDTTHHTTICQQHTSVLPDEHITPQASTQRALSAIVHSQQQAALLHSERTQRIQAEQRLQQREQDHRYLLEAALEGVVLIEEHTDRITDVNPFLLELLGSTREQVVGQKIWHIGLFANHRVLRKTANQVRQQRVVYYQSLSLRTISGQERSVEAAVAGIEINGRHFLQCYLRDLTSSTQAEAAIRLSEARFVALANQVPTMLWQADTDGICIFFNTAWSSFTGLSQTESLGARWIRALHPDDQERAIALWKHTLATQQPGQCHVRLRRADGIYQCMQINAAPWLDPADGCAGYIGTILEHANASDCDQPHQAQTPSPHGEQK